MKPEIDKLYKNRTKDEVNELLKKEGNQLTHQFKEWWDVFQILSECRRFNLPEINAHSILSNRFKLIKKE